jgi:hypothetical protein
MAAFLGLTNSLDGLVHDCGRPERYLNDRPEGRQMADQETSSSTYAIDSRGFQRKAKFQPCKSEVQVLERTH